MSFQGHVHELLGSTQRAAFLKKELSNRQDQANQKAQAVKEAKIKQQKTRRNFMRDYLSQMDMSIGGKVGDLPKEMQQRIAKNYNPSQRKQMMDQMDKERMNNGKKQRT